MDPLTPAELAARLRAGDPDAIDALYRENARSVLAWCIRLGVPGSDAEDAAHEVFATALRLAGSYRGDAAPRTWLFQITRRVVANHRRKAAIRRFFGLDAAPEPTVGPAAERELERAGHRLLVQRALARLPDLQREALVLVDLDERTAVEAAEILGVPVGTVHSRLFAARRAFARAAEAEGWKAEEGQVLAFGRSS
jgi:RNA polymerase sigma-70 factor (ECF subfamily)